MLQLDHVSLTVSEMSSAQAFLETELGFRVSLTPEAVGTHGRIFLDRGYIEVSVAGGQAGEKGQGKLLAGWSHYFLRAADAQALFKAARAGGLPLAEPTIYAGHGGKWLDVEWLDVERVHESLRLILPIIVQRLTPREVAADWPPSLNQLSPNGLQTLSSVYLLATQEEAVKEAGRLLSALLRNPMPVKEWPQNPWLQTREWILPLPSGRRIVLATPSGPGLAESWLGENGPGIFAVGFSAPELKRSMAYLHDRGFSLHRQQPGEALEAEAAWLAPIGDIGVWLFIEQASPGAPRL